jgi:hypothetical protein
VSCWVMMSVVGPFVDLGWLDRCVCDEGYFYGEMRKKEQKGGGDPYFTPRHPVFFFSFFAHGLRSTSSKAPTRLVAVPPHVIHATKKIGVWAHWLRWTWNGLRRVPWKDICSIGCQYSSGVGRGVTQECPSRAIVAGTAKETYFVSHKDR